MARENIAVVLLRLPGKALLHASLRELLQHSKAVPVAVLCHSCGPCEDAWRCERVCRRRPPHAPTVVHERVEDNQNKCACRGQIPVPQADEFRRGSAQRTVVAAWRVVPQPQAAAPDAPRCQVQKIAEHKSALRPQCDTLDGRVLL